ncbi:MAG: flagellar export chaperone FliS [Acidobacteria bacterium]|nr:flagellar export chaperone FliS [Acidobacteriota bacterium]
MSRNPHDAYVESQVLSASPVQLIVMLYGAAIHSLEAARGCLAAGDAAGRAKAVNRATAILAELTQSLNAPQGGDLTRNLLQLYDYLLRRIHEANFQGDDAAFTEAIHLLTTLQEGWESIAHGQSARFSAELDSHHPVHCSL